jgi:hypothetical protein
LDERGRLRFQRNPELDLACAWLTLQEIDDLLNPPKPLPGVFAVQVGGRMPNPRNVEAIRRAVDEIPARLRSLWFRSGSRLEIVPGQNVKVDPESAGLDLALGFWRFGARLGVVAGDHHDCVRTALHEVGHAADRLLGYPSHGEAWSRIWQADSRAGRVSSYAEQNKKPEEYFAESFANLQTGRSTSEAVREFMAYQVA